MNNLQLEKLLNQKLNINIIKDYAPNGLQIEGKSEIKKIITGVTACQALLDYAVEEKADAILVHHGYFWKNEDPRLRGMKGKRIKTLMQNDINLYAYHLPLDIHSELGNNVLFAQAIGLTNLQPMENSPVSIPLWGEFNPPISAQELTQRLEKCLQRTPMVSHENAPNLIHTLGICTGGAQDYIDLAANLNLDGYITGEVSERTIHSAREQGLHFFSAGHHATERFGIRALGEWLQETTRIEVIFKDINNPA